MCTGELNHQEKFKEIVTRSDGRLNSRTFNEKYFVKYNLHDIWKDFTDKTSHMHHLPIKVRAELYISGELNIPKCYCGNLVFYADGKLSRYCSKKCALTSVERGTQISIRMKEKSNEYAEKRRVTMKEKYGVEFNSQRNEIKEKRRTNSILFGSHELLKNRDWCYQQYEIEKKSASDIGIELNIYYGTVLDYLRSHGFTIRQYVNRSKEEKRIQNWFNENYPELRAIYNSRVNSFEYDILIPTKKIAIEINGLYWHSDKAEDYHELKSRNLADYQVFHFTDFDVNNKFNLITSMISSKLDRCVKIFARRCIIKEVTGRVSKEFEELNHIQGHASSKLRYGLYFDNELIQLMTFGKPRFNKNYVWEIIRLCTKMNTIVVGGASKLFSHFLNNTTGSIISYSDNRFGSGNVYSKLNMAYVRDTMPGFTWTDKNIEVSRFKCQKQNLIKWLPTYDETLSQTENMKNAGFRKYYDCGNKVFEMKR